VIGVAPVRETTAFSTLLEDPRMHGGEVYKIHSSAVAFVITNLLGVFALTKKAPYL
jgi:hypothetical protein